MRTETPPAVQYREYALQITCRCETVKNHLKDLKKGKQVKNRFSRSYEDETISVNANYLDTLKNQKATFQALNTVKVKRLYRNKHHHREKRGLYISK